MVVNEAALAMLRAVEVPLAVVAVAGLYRTGKSSLLNWLCDPEVRVLRAHIAVTWVSPHGQELSPQLALRPRGEIA